MNSNGWIPAALIPSHSFFQIIRRLIDPGGYASNYLGHLGHLSVSFCPLLFVHIFAHRSDRLSPIARIGAGRIYLVFKPWALRKPLLIQK